MISKSMICPLILTSVLSIMLTACGDSPSADPKAGKAEHAHEEGEGGHEHEHEHERENEERREAEHADEGTHADEAPHAEIGPEAARAAGIATAQAGPAKLRQTLLLYGSITADAERVRSVGARFPGLVRSVRRSIGDAVARGDVLATVESNESLQTYSVTAPIAGVVTGRNANEGETAGEEPLFVITDLASVAADLNVFARDAAKVQRGQSVRIASVDGATSGEGRVVFVSPLGAAGTQSLVARVRLENPDRRWTPGLYVTGEVLTGETTVGVAVRETALQTFEGRSVVFVPGEHGFEPRTVRLGRADGEWTEVVEGLAAGDTYVSKGSFVVKAELGKGEATHEH